jgi:hypothetical protein
MQVMFLVLFGVSLVVFSLVVREAVALLPYIVERQPLPLDTVLNGLGWLALFLLTFLGTGFFLYERERDEGRVSRRIPLFDWFLDRYRARDEEHGAPAKPIRRA